MPTFSYIPHTEDDQAKMLSRIGISSIDELFSDIPDPVHMKRPLTLRAPLSELELEREMTRLSARNRNTTEFINFIGAGSYDHYKPSVIDAITGRSEFYTSYTPYQPEISQGLLQAIFEYQTMVADLVAMDVANASMYDGPTALGEAALVAALHTHRDTILVSETVHPDYRAVLATYAHGQNIKLRTIPHRNGRTHLEALERELDDEVAGVVVQYPNFFGIVEDVRQISDLAHAKGALSVVTTYPIALGLLQPPGALGADLVTAEGQSLGNPTSFGGPYLGIMAARKSLVRRLPGRIAGQTADTEGRRGFVLTLQAREQHIRREKATSNICSNQALVALAATVYLAYMGKAGMEEVARQNYHKAHYFERQLTQLPGVTSIFSGAFFNEFAIHLPKSAEQIQAALKRSGVLFGVDVSRWYGDLSDTVLLNVTELRSKAEIDETVNLLGALL